MDIIQVLKHSSVKHVDHVDLDGDVVEICRTHFPWSDAWEDPRVKLHIADGAVFVANSKHDFYDVVIQDSSDPYTCCEDGSLVELPSCVLFTQDHFRNVHKTLREKGVFIFQVCSIVLECHCM
jgi:spermidine synthase